MHTVQAFGAQEMSQIGAETLRERARRTRREGRYERRNSDYQHPHVRIKGLSRTAVGIVFGIRSCRRS